MKDLEQQVANLQAELLQAQSKVEELETLRHSCVCVYACACFSVSLSVFVCVSSRLQTSIRVLYTNDIGNIFENHVTKHVVGRTDSRMQHSKRNLKPKRKRLSAYQYSFELCVVLPIPRYDSDVC